jgi:hypothetical protein
LKKGQNISVRMDTLDILISDRVQQVILLCRYLRDATEQKVKVHRNRPEGPGEGGRGIALHILDLGTRRGGWSASRSGRSTPEKDPVHIVHEPGWAPGPACEESRPPPGFDPRTVQPVASRYTDWAITAADAAE